MRKLWLLVLLVPFVAVWLYGCDESPVDPDSAVAATTAQESSTPQAAAKPPTLPTAVKLSWTYVHESTYETGEVAIFAECPDGTYPIAGGWSTGGCDVELLVNHPWLSSDRSRAGWYAGGDISSDCGFFVHAACVQANLLPSSD